MICTEGLLTSIEVMQNVSCTQITKIDLHILTCRFAILGHDEELLGHDEEHSQDSEQMRITCCLLDVTNKRRL
jgi:hypothetical protein